MTIKVGFIGLGAMGLPMASNLVRKGFDVVGFDMDKSKIETLAQLGARAGTSIADAVKDAEVVVTMLPATRHVETVVLGDDGVLKHIKKNAVLMDMSTIDPAGTDKVAAACAEKGIAFADTPVGRLVMHAIKGESLFMVGVNDDATYQRIDPLLNAMGTSINRCGKVGMGTRMKVINNFMLLTITQVCSEAIVLGTKLGWDVETMKAVTGSTTATNGQFQVAMASKALAGDIEPGFTIDLAFKDMGLVLNAAAENRMAVPVGAAAYSAYGAARASKYASKDFSALLNFASDLAGINVPKLK